ncbi:MAG: hypothetical protein R3F03_03205 [Opitutaceae bacterium]
MAAGPYFLEDEPALAARLDAFLTGLGKRLGESAAAADVVALVLSGGYGRGEGGVFRGPSGVAELYNDLEFYLLLRDGNGSETARAWCEREERDGTAELGIDVEFKRLPIGALRTASPSMFYYDLLLGHRLVWGETNWCDALPTELRAADKIPWHEATRLLFNRGSGLFYSRCALATGDERVANGFVERNHAKARLALGDAVLVANGQYHHFARERNARVHGELARTPPGWAELVPWHDEGLAFKLQPRHLAAGTAALAAAQTELAAAWLRTFLWLEGLRLGRTFLSAADYAETGLRLFPATPRWRNVALRLRDWRSRGGALPRWTDYPRGALQRALVLAVDPAAEPTAAALARWLGGAAAPDDRWTALEPAYTRWWSCYN